MQSHEDTKTLFTFRLLAYRSTRSYCLCGALPPQRLAARVVGVTHCHDSPVNEDRFGSSDFPPRHGGAIICHGMN